MKPSQLHDFPHPMTTLAQLRAQHEAKVDEARTLMAKYPANKTMPADVAQQVDSLIGEAEKISAKISAHLASTEDAGERWARGNGAGPGTVTNTDGETVRILRNAADVREHYAGQRLAGEQRAGATDGPPVNLHDFIKGVAGMKTTTGVSAAMSVGTDSSGGYAVPSVVMPGILAALMPASTLLQAGAGIVPLDQGAKTFTFAAVDGVPTAAWRLENGEVVESEPTFRAVVAAPKSLAFYFKISRELLADASNMSAALTLAIAQAFAKELDRAGLRGSGTNPEPRGVRNTPGVQVLAGAEENGTPLQGFGRLFEACRALLQVNAPLPTAAIMSPRSLVTFGGYVDGTGQPMRWPEMLKDMRLLATPSVPDNLKIGTATNTSEIFVGDFSKVLFMMREQMSLQLLHEKFATTGQIGFLAHVRADVAVTYPSALAVLTGVKP